MRLNFLRLIGPKTPAEPPPTPPAAAPETPAEPARNGWEQYLTRDPARCKTPENPELSRCKTPENPELSRALSPYSVGAVHDYLLAWEERNGCELTEEQTAAIVADAESWLERQDQGFLEYVETRADEMMSEPKESLVPETEETDEEKEEG